VCYCELWATDKILNYHKNGGFTMRALQDKLMMAAVIAGGIYLGNYLTKKFPV
jgi:hypothetical protein